MDTQKQPTESEQNEANTQSDKIPWFQKFRQVNICSTIWCSFFIIGLSFGSPTVVIPQLIKETNSTVVTGDRLYPWITSISSYTAVCFVFILVSTSHCFGRKKTMFGISISSLGASIIFYFSSNPTHIFFSQMLYAVTCAGQMTVYAMILTEYTSTKYRGIFLTLKSASFFWGIWTANAIGIFTHYKYIALLSIICSGYCFFNIFFMIDSPYWLAFQGKYDECAKAHRWLKGEDTKAEKELLELLHLQTTMQSNEKQTESTHNNIKFYAKMIIQPDVYKPVSLCLLVFLVYHISGKVVCAVYAIEIMTEITGSESSAHLGMLVLDGFSVLGMYIGCGVSKFLKRRAMLIATSVVGTVFLFIMSLYLYLVKICVLTENGYVAITLLVIYSLAICCGPAILSTSICGELMPVTARSASACFIAALSSLLFATIVKITPLMFDLFYIHGTFLFFGICSAICISITYKFLPETKDKSIYEISNHFTKKAYH